MSLDTKLKQQLSQYLELLENPIVFHASLDESENSQKTKQFLQEIIELSDKLSMEEAQLEYTPSFQINQKGQEASGITFAGIPLGHEFESFVLALLQVGGRAPKISDEQRKRIEKIHSKHEFTTFASLTCHNCPDVVQGLNIMSVLNPLISHTMVEGGMFQDLAEQRGIMAVPAVFDGDIQVASGRQTLDELIDLIADEEEVSFDDVEPFDVLVIGGGPAGCSSAIYAARKGIRTGIITKRFGGQVNDTLGIENFIGVEYTEGPKLMQQIRKHVEKYNIELFEGHDIVDLETLEDKRIKVLLASGAYLISKTVIIATGAHWRDINVPGEKEFKTKGVAYCPHCDGPLFAGKDVAVIGGGNSGVEAAIDLAGIVNKVTLIEFLPELKADQVLQKRLRSLPNVEIFTNVVTTEITGENKVNGITFKDRETDEKTHLDLAGVFVQIGLKPNTEWIKDRVKMDHMGQIEIDAHGQTSMPGVFAAGDCTTVAYKQIMISMGSGAIASLGAFDYLIRNS